MTRLSARIVWALGIAVVVAVGIAAGAASQEREASAEASAAAIRIVLPDGSVSGTETAAAPAGAPATSLGGFAYPGDGTIVAAGASSASASASAESPAAAAAASTSVDGVVLFGGEITADAISATARGRAALSGVSGGFDGTRVVNLRALGRLASGTVTLEDWGVLVVRPEASERDDGAGSFRGSVAAVEIRLTAAHGGLPRGAVIQLGRAEVAVQSGESLPSASEAPRRPLDPAEAPASTPGDIPAGERPPAPGIHVPFPDELPTGVFQPALEGGPYVFPAFGDAAYGNTFGAVRSTVEYHHGNDIFGEVGQPILAVADGTIFSVGWNRVGGLRLWLRDRQGNEFYYAHLSAYSTLASNGARIRAGQVIGFMGATGDARGTIPHLHFEIHPVSLLYLGYDGAVDPTAYIDEWKRLERLPTPLPLAWAPTIPGAGSAPRPGAILLAAADISTASGLDPTSLRRAIAAVPARP
jgi:murein DD-endopeptidase MepM/ murein hydrolase activator NlpD